MYWVLSNAVSFRNLCYFKTSWYIVPFSLPSEYVTVLLHTPSYCPAIRMVSLVPLTFFFLPLVLFLINRMEFSVSYFPPAPHTFSDSSISSFWSLSLYPPLLPAPWPFWLLPVPLRLVFHPLLSSFSLKCSLRIIELSCLLQVNIITSTPLPWTPNEDLQLHIGPLHLENYSKVNSKHTWCLIYKPIG